GEKAWEFLFGARSTFIYKIMAVIAVFVGTIVNLGSVLDFSDMMILGMAFPNILGVVLLSPKVRKDLQAYWTRYKADEFKTYK
ncbi:alanine:cation symporter family protein, partial [Planctomicrobium sp.]